MAQTWLKNIYNHIEMTSTPFTERYTNALEYQAKCIVHMEPGPSS